MTEDLVQLRERLGASAALWAGPAGVQPLVDGWAAFSGARSVDYNVVLCTGGGDAVDGAAERVLATRTPAVVMAAGPALAEVQRFVARDWVCVGATPVMVRRLGDRPATPGAPATTPARARRLQGEADLAAARGLVTEVFEIEPTLAAVALPDERPGHTLWGSVDEGGTLRSCLALVRVQETVVVWSMATDASTRGQGHGRAALEAGLAAAVADGARRALLYASAAGEPFYRRLEFAEAERWQIWTRPRWVLGRA